MAFNGTISGHIGRDPELRFFETGRQVANFTVAVRQPKKDGQDQPARWVKVAVWGKSAEYVGNYIKKGDAVLCIGWVEAPELFTRRDGSQGLAEVFTADVVEKWSGGQQQGQASAPAAQPVAPPPLPLQQQQPLPPHLAAAGWTGAVFQQQAPAPAPASAPVWQSSDLPF